MSSQLFRRHHTLQLLDRFSPGKQPLDSFLRDYFREHSALGSKDRKVVAEAIYGVVRWLGLIDSIASRPLSSAARLEAYEKLNLSGFEIDQQLSPHIRLSFPKSLYSRLLESLGKEKTEQFCKESNLFAPTTIRLNPLKSSREELLRSFENRIPLTPCPIAPLGFRVPRGHDLRNTAEFRNGWFEIQDEASQLVSALVEAKEGEELLDFCAGSGGKSLAIAALRMQGDGQIYLHDIRSHALQEAKKRLRRAGVQNGQIILPKELSNKKFKDRFDWVLVDAPCSGSGTLRRNPDMKWRFQEEEFRELLSLQRNIVEKALTFLKPGGFLVYATCSILSPENQEQVDYFITRLPLRLVRPPFISFPEPGGMDGFFGAVLEKI